MNISFDTKWNRIDQNWTWHNYDSSEKNSIKVSNKKISKTVLKKFDLIITMSTELQLKRFIFMNGLYSLELGKEKSKNFQHWPSFTLVKVYKVSLWCSINYLHLGLAQSILLLLPFQHGQGVKFASISENHCFPK